MLSKVCCYSFFRSNFGLSLKERNFVGYRYFPSSKVLHPRQIPFLSLPNAFPSRKKKTKKLPSFSISLSLYLYVLVNTHARASSFISCFNFRWTRVTLDRPRKLLKHRSAGRPAGKKMGKKIGAIHRKLLLVEFSQTKEPSQTFI